MKKYIKGKYKRSIFKSNNGYVIGLIKIKETNDDSLLDYINKTMTFTGYFIDLNEEDDYIFYGNMIEHPKYGIQYQVDESERIKPEDKDGIVEFLSSDLFPGVGEKLAIRIVDTLGEDTLDKILEDKDNLKLVPKINNKKIDLIYDILTKYEESHKIVIYLTELGFNMYCGPVPRIFKVIISKLEIKFNLELFSSDFICNERIIEKTIYKYIFEFII